MRVHMKITGRVQGVFFRDSCRQMAARLGVNGWVRNCADGSVEVAAEGSRDAVDALVAWCHDGPARATVAGVQLTDEEPKGVTGFRLKR